VSDACGKPRSQSALARVVPLHTIDREPRQEGFAGQLITGVTRNRSWRSNPQDRGERLNYQLKESKRAIRNFLRTAYTDERLAWLLAHARSGRLVYNSCCCLVGVVTADHSLQGKVPVKELASSHYALAKTFVGASSAERAYQDLGYIGKTRVPSADEVRRRRLVPLVKAEIWRRERIQAERPTMPAMAGAGAGRRRWSAGRGFEYEFELDA